MEVGSWNASQNCEGEIPITGTDAGVPPLFFPPFIRLQKRGNCSSTNKYNGSCSFASLVQTMEKRERKRYCADNDQVLKTRVCLKNIPHDFKETDLRNFLLNRLGSSTTITDCRILKDAKSGKSRGIAFCGFLEESQANNCVEQLNKSYCKSSRLLVEFATSVKEKTQEKNAESEFTKKTEKTKEKHEKVAPILQEKHKVTTLTTKRKFWANDDVDEGGEGDIAPPLLPDVSSDTEFSDGSDSEDDADPLKERSRQSDLDFLLSKKVAVDNFDKVQPDDDFQESLSGGPENNNDKQTSQESFKPKDKVAEEESVESQEIPEEDALESISKNRLFLRNLPFTAAEEDIREYFAAFGTILECHIPADDQKRSKGFGFVKFEKANDAEAAMSKLDGTDFQGRLLHILPAREAVSKSVNATQGGGYKEKAEAERKGKALYESTGWSASHVRGDAVVDNLAVRLGLRKGDIMAVKDGLTGGDAAVRLALAETAIIEENRQFFADHGYNMDALVSPSGITSITRSNVAILVKNLPHDTAKDELAKMFSSKGEEPSSIILPPSKTLAVIEYSHGNDAKLAFRRLAFRRFKNVPLYLEWAPLAAVTKDAKKSERPDANPVIAEDADENEDEIQASITPTLYVKNLNFKTTEATLHKLLSQDVKDIRSIRIPQKRGPTKQGSSFSESQSMGYCFIEFGSPDSASKALKLLHGKIVDGHALDVKPSAADKHKSAPLVNSTKESTKLVVRNVPFQANRKELMQLFGSLGHLKKVRMPRKFDGTSRGYAFVEYLTNKEAVAAMKALSRTHLYGRHLVIEWAAMDEEANQMDSLRSKAERDLAAPPKNKKIRFD
ncbi:multiple RNA-binding domain-containing protein 1 [Fistulifera solaris]|uniref:Multiple RNA-binding domain-containing protein 1 n=1 Tax=Fistulifera solaris TaxID=1519565 RepID=A0A1Z5KEN0_FISSO|nr:multiple RNA-binding domain-containing protein 1 [Fistulifera solaris]|eukprot:GAX24646.1 multiple RNA-binding domain-containing protein 1 [Fistulifera solaris]